MQYSATFSFPEYFCCNFHAMLNVPSSISVAEVTKNLHLKADLGIKDIHDYTSHWELIVIPDAANSHYTS